MAQASDALGAKSQREPCILVVDDSPGALSGLEAILRPRYAGILSAASASEALAVVSRLPVDLVITDVTVSAAAGLDLISRIRAQSPETLVIVVTGLGTVESAVDAMKRGAYHCVAKPFCPDDILLQVEMAMQRVSLEREAESLHNGASGRGDFYGMIAQSDKMHDLFEFVKKVAPTDAPVMIRGESGTGKELIARAIHLESDRRAGRFLGINTAALPEQLLEAELFGYRRGAFTGAVADKEGLLIAARGGTVFLDEISGMPASSQAKLLRAIEEMEVLPIGGLAAVKIDVRFISATNSERLDEIRHDLFYRLGVMEIKVPPLRERIEDVPLLATTFVQKYSRKFARGIKRLSVEALEMLMRHHWPGNVRELENIMQRAVVVSPADEIRPSDIKIPGALEPLGAASGDWPLPYEQARRRALLSFQRAYFEALFKRTGANISRAARQANVTRAALYGIMRKTGITPRKRVQQQT